MEITRSTNRPRCPLCGAPALEDRWTIDRLGRPILRCGRCSLAWVPEHARVDETRERERYLEHNNDRDNPAYRAYLWRFIEAAITPWLEPPARILDFGSGPVPVLSEILADQGFRVASYDPFFAPDTAPLEAAAAGYDAVVLLEVVEHLFNPGRELERIMGLLTPTGYLAMRTSLRPLGDGEFAGWWYTTDRTHVTFLAAETIEWMCRFFGLRWVHRAPGEIILLRRG